MFVFYKHDKSSIYEENAIHYPFKGQRIFLVGKLSFKRIA